MCIISDSSKQDMEKMMEKIRTYPVKTRPNKYWQFGVPTHWIEEYLPEGGELELYQDGGKLILIPKKNNREKAACK